MVRGYPRPPPSLPVDGPRKPLRLAAACRPAMATQISAAAFGRVAPTAPDVTSCGVDGRIGITALVRARTCGHRWARIRMTTRLPTATGRRCGTSRSASRGRPFASTPTLWAGRQGAGKAVAPAIHVVLPCDRRVATASDAAVIPACAGDRVPSAHTNIPIRIMYTRVITTHPLCPSAGMVAGKAHVKNLASTEKRTHLQ